MVLTPSANSRILTSVTVIHPMKHPSLAASSAGSPGCDCNTAASEGFIGDSEMTAFIDLTGMTFARLTVLGRDLIFCAEAENDQ